MDLFQLETFLAVAEERSFSRAAARLHRTQPAVSQAIAKLEGELGGGTLRALLPRWDAHRCRGRPARVRPEASQSPHRGLEALAELRGTSQRQAPDLAANEYTCLYLLPLLDEFRRQHPRIKVAVQRSLASRITDEVLMHSVEIGVLSFPPRRRTGKINRRLSR